MLGEGASGLLMSLKNVLNDQGEEIEYAGLENDGDQ